MPASPQHCATRPPSVSSQSCSVQNLTGSHAQVVASGTSLYIIGGIEQTDTVAVASLYEYDTVRQQYVQLADMPQPNCRGGAALLDGKLYVVSGLASADDSGAPLSPLQPGGSSQNHLPLTQEWATYVRLAPCQRLGLSGSAEMRAPFLLQRSTGPQQHVWLERGRACNGQHGASCILTGANESGCPVRMCRALSQAGPRLQCVYMHTQCTARLLLNCCEAACMHGPCTGTHDTSASNSGWL